MIPKSLEVRRLHPSELGAGFSDMAGAGLFHDPRWLGLWESCYRQEGIYLAAYREGIPVGALPLVRKASRLFGRYWVSMPYFDAAGCIGEPAAEPVLLDAALALARERRDPYVEVRTHQEKAWNWHQGPEKVHVVSELPSSGDALLAGFPKKVRSQVRRAAREGAEVVWGGPELLGEFYDVYTKRMRELGSPPHARTLLSGILDAFPEASRILVLRLEGEAVSSAFLLRDGGTMTVPWAATLTRVNPLGMNMLLYFEAMTGSIAEGARRFDFGRCDPEGGHLRFKLQWGGVQRPLYWYRATTDGSPPPEDPRENARMQLASRLWRRLPLFVTRRVGPRLMRNFS